MASGAEVMFNTIVPSGLTPFLEKLHRAGFTRRGGTIVCTYFDENFLNLVPAEQVEGLYGCLDYYRDVDDPFSIELLGGTKRFTPGNAMFTAGSASTGTYRALKLWEAAVTEAGSLDQDDVIVALDHARISEGPGGPDSPHRRRSSFRPPGRRNHSKDVSLPLQPVISRGGDGLRSTVSRALRLGISISIGRSTRPALPPRPATSPFGYCRRRRTGLTIDPRP